MNIPLNAISPTSAEHLQDKLLKLSRLISGQPVEAGHSQFVASKHPEGIIFCKNLLAKKFVVSNYFGCISVILSFFLQFFFYKF